MRPTNRPAAPRLASLLAVAALLAGCAVGAPAEDPDARAADASRADAAQEPDAAPEVDAAVAADTGAATQDAPAPVQAEPFAAPAREWRWVEVDGARCANGEPTGVGVNLVPGSNDVLVFLQGGGACWDGASCWGPVSTSFFVRTGYGPSEFAVDVLRPALLPLRRHDLTNPFRNVNIVYVPYCTGDVHAGDRVNTYEHLGVSHRTYHVGYRNLGLILDRVAATFPSLRRMWLAGDSAGGFGAALNLDRTQRRFPRARVDVLDDSGQPIQPAGDRWSQWSAAWNVQIPADCARCRSDIGAFVDYYRQRYPQNRFGLISYTHDAVISAFMGHSQVVFWDRLRTAAQALDASWDNGRYYFLPGALHVGLATPTPGLIRWIEQFMSDDPTWRSVSP